MNDKIIELITEYTLKLQEAIVLTTAKYHEALESDADSWIRDSCIRSSKVLLNIDELHKKYVPSELSDDEFFQLIYKINNIVHPDKWFVSQYLRSKNLVEVSAYSSLYEVVN